MATIHITDLTLKTIIGTNDWERTTKQKVVINVSLEYDASAAAKSDNIGDAVDYKKITKKIISMVRKSKFHLLEKLTQNVLDIVLEDKKIKKASVRIDKPLALRFAKSVSLERTSFQRK